MLPNERLFGSQKRWVFNSICWLTIWSETFTLEKWFSFVEYLRFSYWIILLVMTLMAWIFIFQYLYTGKCRPSVRRSKEKKVPHQDYKNLISTHQPVKSTKNLTISVRNCDQLVTNVTETGVLVTRILRLVNIGQLTFSILNWCSVVSFAAIIRYIMQHFS